MVGDWAWRVGISVLTGVPAIIGGGIMFHFTHNWAAVVIYEIFLLFLLSVVLVAGGKRGEEAAH